MTASGTYKYHLIALLTMCVWGTTFVSTKVLINNGLSPAEIFFIRFLLAYICIWAVAHKRLWAESLRDEAALASLGLLGGSFYFLTENIALQYAPASNVSLIVCMAPLFTSLLVGRLHRDERMSARRIAGSVAAFAGMILVVLNGRYILQLSPKGDALAFASALSWTFYSLVMKTIGPKYPALFISRKVFFYGLLTIIPVMAIAPPAFDMAILARPVVWGNLIFLGLIASMLCYVLWNVALRHLGVVRATNYGYLNPLVTMITAALCIGERITPAAVCGAALILIGMWWTERK